MSVFFERKAGFTPGTPGPIAILSPEKTGTPGEWRIVEGYKEPGLKGFFHRLIMRVSVFFHELIHGKPVLTPAGRCFVSYCRSIADGTLRPDQHVAAYEEQLSTLTGLFNGPDGLPPEGIPREVLAETVVYFTSGMKAEA